jgi:hypothetical protein
MVWHAKHACTSAECSIDRNTCVTCHYKGKSATPTANNCQGQAKPPHSVSVPQSHDCTHKRENWLPPTAKQLSRWSENSVSISTPVTWLYTQERTVFPHGKTTVKVKRKLLSQYQYPSHMIVHTRENRLPPTAKQLLRWSEHSSVSISSSVTWLQLLRKHTNTDTSAALPAESRWSTRTRLRAISRLVAWA